MIAAVRPQADLLRRHADLLNDTRPRRDVALFLPFRRWLETHHCAASDLAAELVRRNIPFEVSSEEEFAVDSLAPAKVLLVENAAVFTAEETAAVDEFKRRGGKVVVGDEEAWLDRLIKALGAPSVTIDGPSTIRAYVHDQPGRTIVHLLNLNVRRLSSFVDAVTPASDVRVKARVPFPSVRSVISYSADKETAKGQLAFISRPVENEVEVEFVFKRLDIAAIVEIRR